jgi:hypothetical protein
MMMLMAVAPKLLLLHKNCICLFFPFFIGVMARFGAARFFRDRTQDCEDQAMKKEVEK